MNRTPAELSLARALGYTVGPARLRLSAPQAGSGAYIPEPPELTDEVTADRLMREAAERIRRLLREAHHNAASYEGLRADLISLAERERDWDG